MCARIFDAGCCPCQDPRTGQLRMLPDCFQAQHREALLVKHATFRSARASARRIPDDALACTGR
eukprot:3010893-Pleurochrysis_carterae.AAC.2